MNYFHSIKPSIDFNGMSRWGAKAVPLLYG